MRCFILLLFTTQLFISCSNTSGSKSDKELEQKQYELDLREKELDLKEEELNSAPASKLEEETSSDSETFTYEGMADYIPINEPSKQTASFILSYSHLDGANLPSLDIQFGDGFEMYFKASCEGDYFWCIRNAEFEDIGYMKLTFEKNGKIAKIKIKKNALSGNYIQHLNQLSGTLHKK